MDPSQAEGSAPASAPASAPNQAQVQADLEEGFFQQILQNANVPNILDDDNGESKAVVFLTELHNEIVRFLRTIWRRVAHDAATPNLGYFLSDYARADHWNRVSVRMVPALRLIKILAEQYGQFDAIADLQREHHRATAPNLQQLSGFTRLPTEIRAMV